METTTPPPKRGRPKKVVSFAKPKPLLETSKRKQSTTTAQHVSRAGDTAPKIPPTPTTRKAAGKPLKSASQTLKTATVTPSVHQSQILQQVASKNKAPGSTKPKIDTPASKKPSTTSPSIKAAYLPAQSLPCKNSATPFQPETSPPSNPKIVPIAKSLSASPTQDPKPPVAASAPNPTISPKSLNVFAVSQLSGVADRSRSPPKFDNDRLPPNYKPIARKITFALVAAPIAIVTSWVLWERLVLGQERKKLIREPGGVILDKPQVQGVVGTADNNTST